MLINGLVATCKWTEYGVHHQQKHAIGRTHEFVLSSAGHSEKKRKDLFYQPTHHFISPHNAIKVYCCQTFSRIC